MNPNASLAAAGTGVIFRQPSARDGARVWALIREAGTLDVNSAYCYMMLCEYFSKTCLLAEQDGALCGFVSAFRVPGREDTLFVWQIAVHPERRGQGLGRRLLEELLERLQTASRVTAEAGPSHAVQPPIRYIEATISPSNEASRALFRGLARRLKAGFEETAGMPEDWFPVEQRHEEERLFRIGPLAT